jgi:hypothetical protein
MGALVCLAVIDAGSGVWAINRAATSRDTDGDGLRDSFETSWSKSDPLRADTDLDGVPDGAEDPDGDGLSNLGEQRVGTDPTKWDTDGDGIDDAHDDADRDGERDGIEQDDRPVPSDLTPSLSEASHDTPQSLHDGCRTSVGSATIHPCAYGDLSGTLTVVLFGDSHALQWEPALIRAAQSDHWRLVVLSKSGCPSVDVRYRSVGFPYDVEPCLTWRARAIAWIKRHPPDLVILSNSRSYLLVDSRGHEIQYDTGWADGLRRTLSRLPGVAARLVIGDTVRMQRNPPGCLKRHGDSMVRCETARAKAWSHHHDRVEKSVTRADHATFVSLNRLVCPYDPCPVVMGDVMMWRNDSHLTATFARSLWRSVAAAVSPAI